MVPEIVVNICNLHIWLNLCYMVRWSDDVDGQNGCVRLGLQRMTGVDKRHMIGESLLGGVGGQGRLCIIVSQERRSGLYG